MDIQLLLIWVTFVLGMQSKIMKHTWKTHWEMSTVCLAPIPRYLIPSYPAWLRKLIFPLLLVFCQTVFPLILYLEVWAPLSLPYKVSSSLLSILFLSTLFILCFIFPTLHDNISSKWAVTCFTSLSQYPHYLAHVWHKAGIQKYLLNKCMDWILLKFRHEK